MNKIASFFLLLIISSCTPSNEVKVTIAVAANMQYAMEDIIEKFESRYDVKVETSSGSSGILATQIRQGAPFDIFLSANIEYPKLLYDEGLATSLPSVYAHGTLILWTLKDELNLEKGLLSLLNSGIKKIAIANTKTAPYGIAALEALTNSNVYADLQSKIVVGESIGQVNQYTLSNAVDVGITTKAVLFSPFVINKGKSFEIPRTYYAPISQSIVLLKHGQQKNLSNSEQFYKFMFSKEAQTILLDYGYDLSK